MKKITDKMNDIEYIRSLPTNRLVAITQGSPHYYSTPCKHGHDVYRRTVNGACALCASIATARRNKQMPAEKLAKYKAKADSNWNSSDKGKTSKQRWKERDPKWAWVVSAVGGAKTRSKVQNVPFSIDNQYILSITPDKCPVFGTAFIFVGGAGGNSAYSASIDKIIPELGYVAGNVAVISARANTIKNNATLDEIMKVYEWMNSNTK